MKGSAARSARSAKKASKAALATPAAFRYAIWDVETHDLKPEFGPLLCAAVLLMPEGAMVTMRQDAYIKGGLAADMTDDRQLCCDLRDLLHSRHMHVGYFSTGFDVKQLRTRLAWHGERNLLQRRLHADPIWSFKGWRGLDPMSAKMKNVAKFFRLPEQKPDVLPEVWLKARQGQRAAMDEIVERCEADVRITNELFVKVCDLGLLTGIRSYP